MPKAGLIVMVMPSVPELRRSVACTVNIEVPSDVGVPLMLTLLPLVELRPRPAGGEPAEMAHVHRTQGSVVSVAVRVREYETETSP